MDRDGSNVVAWSPRWVDVVQPRGPPETSQIYKFLRAEFLVFLSHIWDGQCFTAAMRNPAVMDLHLSLRKKIPSRRPRRSGVFGSELRLDHTTSQHVSIVEILATSTLATRLRALVK